MKSFFTISAALLSVGVQAFPSANPGSAKLPRGSTSSVTQPPKGSLSSTETNCGPEGPCLTFDATSQYVSNTGAHAYQSPAATDIRGPCPGLNAAANHGYLPRSGVAGIVQTISGLGDMYSMSAGLAGFLAAYAIALDGDVISLQWSIGGPQANGALLPGLLGQAQGISYSHNNYEGDTSIGRNDAYMNGGDAYSLNATRFAEVYATGLSDDRYTLDRFRADNEQKQYFSIANNPYYFAPLFSTTLVAPAAYNFVINFMSNHSETEKSGYLDGERFKSWFAITGDYPNFEWVPGTERMPDNWYKRPAAHAYNIPNVFMDLFIGWAARPDTFRFGGNLNGTNSWTGINIADLTGSSYDIDSLFEGDNFACLLFQTEQQALPDAFKTGVNDVTAAMALINKYTDGIFNELSCPQLSKYDATLFNSYPGHSYSPTPPTTGH